MPDVDWRTCCGIWEQPHSLGIILSSESGGLTDAEPVLKLMENLVLASHTPGKLADFKKNLFSSFPQSTLTEPQRGEDFSLFGCLSSLHSNLPPWAGSLVASFFSSPWSSAPKNDVSFVITWKYPETFDTCRDLEIRDFCGPQIMEGEGLEKARISAR